MPNKLISFISTASVQALQWSSACIMSLYAAVQDTFPTACRSCRCRAIDVPSCLLSLLSIFLHSLLLFIFHIPALWFPNLSPGLVSLVCFFEYSPCPLSLLFPCNFQLLFSSFPNLLPWWLKVSKVGTTDTSPAIGNDRWPFTALPAYLLLIWY